MPTTLNPGTGGEVVETVNRNGSTDERQVVEFGYVPTYWALTGALTFTASRFQFVLYNNSSLGAIVQVRKVVFLYSSAVAVTTPVVSGPWSQRIRTAPTTDPSGAGSLTIQTMDSADTLPANITAFSSPGTPQAGGTAKDLSTFIPQPDEVKLTTLDAPTMASMNEYSGITLYDFSSLGPNAKPITLRQDQCYEIQQDATAGTGAAYRILCIFTAF